MTDKKWVTAARIDHTSGTADGSSGMRGILLGVFWLWGFGGLAVNGMTFLGLPSNVGVGTSAYLAAMLLLWIGGMVLFGLGAIAISSSYEFKRGEAQTTEQ